MAWKQSRFETAATSVLVLVLVAVVVAGGCGVAKEQGGDTAQTDSATVDVSLDVPRQDNTAYEAACPGEAQAAQTTLIPTPVTVFTWGAVQPLSDSTLSWEGQAQMPERELERMAEDFALTVTPDGALRIVIHTDDQWAALRKQCGFETPASEAYYLSTAVAEGTAVAHVYGDAAGRFYAIKTLRQLLSGDPVSLQEVDILDYPATPIRGVVEGFYGLPWDKSDRLAMMAYLADLKMNTFVYAPKDDPWINAAWMAQFPEDELRHMRDMTDAATKQRIRLCWELHIGWALSFSSAADLDLMVDKFDSIGQQGIDCFVLAFDDVNKFLSDADQNAYGGYAEAQADFVTRLDQRLMELYPQAMLAFVPVEYWTDHEDTNSDLAYLGKQLPPQWMIAWTGKKIVSATISEQDAEEIAAILQRPAFLGDNYPVVDGSVGEVLLGPLTGREPGVALATSGSVFNPMPLPFASLPALATTADWAWNPQAYVPEDSASRSAFLYAGAKDQEAVTAFFLSNRSTILEASNAPELVESMQAFWDAWEAAAPDGIATAAANLQQQFLAHYVALDDLAQGAKLHPALQQLVPWMDAQARYAQAVIDVLALLEGKAAGTAPAAEAVDSLVAVGAELGNLTYRPTGTILPDFLGQCLEALAD